MVLQAVQVPPSLPQAARVVPPQVFPWQQPFEHEVALQTQLPEEQVWPETHWAPVPQPQVPFDSQALARLVLQATQAPPSIPQAETEGVVQVVPEQQPVGQPVLSQTQPLPVQCCPVAQAAPPLQVQLPEELQPLARVVLQDEQATPLSPQLVLVGGLMQVTPLQQPFAQLDESQPVQAWLTQVLGEAHAAQLAPFFPQAELEVPAWQRPLLSQQPFGQEVASQTQLPLTQWVPVPQAAWVPQAQAPLLLQWSEVLVLQATQTAPFTPQVVGKFWVVTQEVPLQQPVGQEVALQTQAPPSQV